MAAEVGKPDLNFQWASGGAIVAPSDVKIQTGWTAEVPPFQWENFLQNRQDNGLLHLFQKGISEWDALSNYYFTASGTRSFVQGSDGNIYVAVQDSLGQNPTTDTSDTYWTLAFPSQQTNYALDTGTANTYAAAYDPIVKLPLVDGQVVRFKALNANTGASTFSPNGTTARPIVGQGHVALQGGEILTNGDVRLQWNSSIGGGSWIMLDNSSGALQTVAATKANHAVNLNEFLGVFSGTGYIKIPAFVAGVKRTLIFQWVTQASVGVGGVVTPFPIVFPAAVMIQWCTVSVNSGPLTQYAACVSPPSLTTIQTVVNTGTQAVAAFAIGY